MDEVRAERDWVKLVLPVAVLLLAAFFRLYRLPTMPWGLSQDEVVNADISLGLLEGGHAPFLAGGYGHEPLFHYLQAATLVLFGDNAVGIRMPAVITGMLFVAVSYVLVHQWFNSATAVAAAAGLAISWWPIIFSRIGIRAITFPLLFTLAVYLFWRGAKGNITGQDRQSGGISWFVLAGVCLGLSFYTYSASSVIFLIVPGWLLYGLAIKRSAIRKCWRGIVITLGVAILLALPLFLYLRVHPELTERLRQLSEPLAELRQGNPASLWQSVRATSRMFSSNGEGRWTYGVPSRPILEPASGVLFYIGLFICITSFTRAPYGMALIWFLAALVPSLLTPDAPSTIRAIGALPMVYGMVGITVGWLWHNASESARVLKIILTIIFVAVLAWNMAWTLHDGYYIWASHPQVYWLYKAHFADIAHFIDEQVQPLPVIVNEEWIAPLDIDGIRRDLRDDTRQLRWIQAGRAFVWPADATEFVVAVPIYSSTDADLWSLLAGDPPVLATSGFLMKDGRPGTTFYAARSEPILAQTLERVSRGVVSTPVDSQRLTLPLNFGDEYALLGYELWGEAAAGEVQRMITVWRVMCDAPADVSIFVHMLDADGDLVSQFDGFDTWAPALKSGDVIAQLHSIEIATDVPSGSYQIQAGMYLQEQSDRLPVMVDGEQVADRVWLDTIKVSR
jgi:4-amino-4-deoxy-L-arabinose transferase-like glycosyltransferase